jgi:hypothetical protein
VGVLGGPLLGLLVLLPPGPYEGPDDLFVRLLLGAQGREEQALGGVGSGELLQLLGREILQGVEGLGWDLLLDGRTKRAPGGGVLRDLARDAPHERGAGAGFAGQGVGLDAAGEEHLLEPRNVLAELGQHATGIQARQAAC